MCRLLIKHAYVLQSWRQIDRWEKGCGKGLFSVSSVYKNARAASTDMQVRWWPFSGYKNIRVVESIHACLTELEPP
jgi:hypothetical protein